jgi:cytoskeletal protein CcmA (bactofilin family)
MVAQVPSAAPAAVIPMAPVLTAAVDFRAALPRRTAVSQFATWLVDADTVVVPAGTCIDGDIEAPCVHVKGTVRGRVVATQGALVVDKGAVVHGVVEGHETVVIAGQVCARSRKALAVWAHGPLHLAGGARVRGTVRYVDITVYEGAKVAGRVLPGPA